MEWVLSFQLYVDSRAQTHVFRTVASAPTPLCHLTTGPCDLNIFFFTFILHAMMPVWKSEDNPSESLLHADPFHGPLHDFLKLIVSYILSVIYTY